MWTVGLLASSMAFVLNATVVIHELGHLVMDRRYGLDAHLVLELFRGSHIALETPFPPDLSIVPVVAGPLGNVLVGMALFSALWWLRRPALLPLLLWGPIALLQESTTALVQLAEDLPATDFIMIRDAGVPAGWIVFGAVVGLLLGLTGMLSLMPVAGLSPESAPVERIGIFVAGMSGWSLLVVMVSLTMGLSRGDLIRSLGPAALVIACSVGLACAYGPVGRRFQVRPRAVSRRPVLVATGMAVAVIGLYLVV